MRRQFASDNYAGVCPEAWDTQDSDIESFARDLRELTRSGA